MLVSPRFTSLQQWLAWQETLHPSAIDLGLERVSRVADRLGCRTPAPVVISVAGTNGKGSCVAMLEAILLRAGCRVGAYTSPHLYRYNERVRLDGKAVADQTLCDLFARVDAARERDSLTYFEFGTLAALDLMSRQDLDVALLEVGLGGRLDAVNIVDADVALITSIGIDHTDWLGPDRDAIAREKAGIMRRRRPVVCGDSDPPASLAAEAARRGATLIQVNRDFSFTQADHHWHWQGCKQQLRALPLPALPGRHQLSNAASVLSVLEVLEPRLRVTRETVEAGLRRVSLPGRVQHIGGPVDQLLDVSHNAQAAQALADVLRAAPAAGHRYLVLGMMRDKDVTSFVQPLRPYVDTWYATGLQVKRASPVGTLAAGIRAQLDGQPVVTCATMQETLAALKAVAEPGDRIVVCGSFYTVAEWSALKPQFS
jgi:dihydrofolate synthase/folylpolyglutamate synthase